MLLGNTESIEDLGVNVNVALLETTNAFKTLANGRSWEQLNFQTQQQIRLMAILEQTSAKFGSSIQQNTNYQLMQLTANLKNIGLNLGNAFMPIVSVVLPVLNSMALALANVTNKIAAFMNALFGTNFNAGAGEVQQVASELGGAGTGASGLADGMNDAAGGAEKAGKAAKKAGKEAKGALANFDEINTLSKPSGDSGGNGGSGGAGGGGAGGVTDTGVVVSNTMSQAAESFADKVKDVMDRLKGLFQEGFEIGLGADFEDRVADIKESIAGIKASLKDIFTDSEVVASAARLADAIAFNLGKITGSIASIGVTIAQNLLGGIDKYLAQNSQYIKDRLVGIMDASADIMNLAGDFAVAFADIFTVFGGETGQQCTANIIGIFENAFLGSLELALKFGRDILECITQPIIENKDKIKLAIENSLKVFESLSGTVKDAVTHLFEQAISVYDEYIDPAFERIKNGISEILGAILDAYNTYIAPMLQRWAAEFQGLYDEHLKPIMDQILVIVGKLVELLSTLWQNILAPIASWLISTLGPAVSAILDMIWSTFIKVSEVIIERLESLLTVLEGVIDFLTGVFSGDWERAWQGIQEITQGIGELIYEITIGALIKIVEWLGDVFSTAWQGAVETIKNFFTPLAEWFNANVITPITQFFTNLWNGIKQTASTCWQGLVSAWQGASQWFNNSVVEPIKQFFTQLWENLKQTATTCWQGVQSAWQSASTWFSTTIIEPIKQKFNEWSNNVKQLAATAWNGVKTAWQTANSWFTSTIITPIKTGFSNAWNNIKSLASSCVTGIKSSFQSFKGFIDGIISSIKSAFSGLWSNVTSSCKSAINGILNKVESGINSMANKVNSVTSKVGINVPTVKLPKLARGGIVDGATNFGNFVAGEAGREMVVPLENTSFTDKIASAMGQAVMNAMSVMLNSGGMTGNDGQNVVLEMDGTALARTVTPYVVKEMQRLNLI